MMVSMGYCGYFVVLYLADVQVTKCNMVICPALGCFKILTVGYCDHLYGWYLPGVAGGHLNDNTYTLFKRSLWLTYMQANRTYMVTCLILVYLVGHL